jgi:DNA-binding transcriptional LysR family regulator
MIAKTQYQLSSFDLETILSVVRFGSLARASERLGMDSSTVFRNIQRIERQLGQSLFERSKSGYLPREMAVTLSKYAEKIETELEFARNAALLTEQGVNGIVRIATTDTILQALVTPAIVQFRRLHPLLQFELLASSELVNLSRRDADIAVRATKRPPPHLVGKQIGPLRVAAFSGKSRATMSLQEHIAKGTPWIAPDDALPEHPSVLWRQKHVPKAYVQYRVNSILSVADLIGHDAGIGIIPLFLANSRDDLTQISEPLDEAETALWLLTHTESRHLRRISAVFSYFSEYILLP